MSNINEHVLEVRYKPNPRILDYRGSWAEAISEHMKLPEWKIVENRVDIYKGDESERAFVGYRNAGYIANDTQTNDYFPVKAVKFLKFLFTLEGFGKNLYIERLGVRSRFCKEYKGSFDELRNKYTSNYLFLTEKAKKLINAKLLDIGGPLNFADKYGNFNTASGPMEKKQIEQFFKRDEELSDVGLYFDIDYWLKPKKAMKGDEVLDLIQKFAFSSWERFDGLNKLIFEG